MIAPIPTADAVALGFIAALVLGFLHLMLRTSRKESE
jgi:hypothetical protein